MVTIMPKMKIPEVLLPLVSKRKRFKIVVGGRGSGKSHTVADICLMDAQTKGVKVGCFREFQVSIKDSVKSLLEDEIDSLGLEGFVSKDTEIEHSNGARFVFKGLARNVDSVKSMSGFDRFIIEEAQTISKKSIEVLTPTLREEESEIWMIANPGSTEDPFSQRFLVPYWDHLIRDGFYEDDLHLIIVCNYKDNPFFPEVLEKERLFDLANKPRALYDHIWLGHFNDSVESALIQAEWFDACVDADKKLGFKPTGVKLAAHDPSDVGPDPKGYAMRHGSVVLDAQEMSSGTVNEGGHWACGQAIQQGVDQYTWDCDGMGIALSEQTSADFDGKRTKVVSFRGSESPDNPKQIYKPAAKSSVDNQKTVKDTFKNKRAQYYFELRDRCYRTYRAVEFDEYHDPDTLISFSSDIIVLKKIRAELCRMPIKPNGNGLFDLYTKQEMKSKFKFASPNLGDSIMMLMRYTPEEAQDIEITFDSIF